MDAPCKLGGAAMTRPPELYACVYVRELPAQALLRLRPELHDKPCVVLEGEPPSESVCAMNTRARLHSLRHGMTKVEVETFENVMVLQRSQKTEAAVRTILLECAGAFSPRIEDQSINGLFVCVLDAAGTEGLFGPPLMLARHIRKTSPFRRHSRLGHDQCKRAYRSVSSQRAERWCAGTCCASR